MTFRTTGEFIPPFAVFIGLLFACRAANLQAGEAAPGAAAQTVQLSLPATAPPISGKPPESLGDILKLCLQQALTEEYVDDRKWGRTTERFDGFRVKGLRVSKREREVNHGFWQRYSARLVRPAETLQVQIQQLPGDGPTVRFQLLLTLRAHCEVTFAWWNYGVKGWNGTAESDATIQLRLVLETRPELKFSLETPLPRVSLDPKVAELDLKIKDIDLRRIGVLEGPGVTLLGDGSRKAIEELVQQQSVRLKAQLQKKIDDAVGSP